MHPVFIPVSEQDGRACLQSEHPFTTVCARDATLTLKVGRRERLNVTGVVFSFKTAHPQGNDSVQIESRLSLSPGMNIQQQQRAIFSRTCKKTKTNRFDPAPPHC